MRSICGEPANRLTESTVVGPPCLVITHILVLRKRGITLSLSKRDSERLPGLQGRKIAPFDRLRMRFCPLWPLWVITSSLCLASRFCHGYTVISCLLGPIEGAVSHVKR